MQSLGERGEYTRAGEQDVSSYAADYKGEGTAISRCPLAAGPLGTRASHPGSALAPRAGLEGPLPEAQKEVPFGETCFPFAFSSSRAAKSSREPPFGDSQVSTVPKLTCAQPRSVISPSQAGVSTLLPSPCWQPGTASG